MSVWTLFSRLTGYVRVWAMAVALGVTMHSLKVPIASSFNIANNIPNMIYELAAGGVLSAMFIPIFMEKLSRDGESDARKFANTLFGLTGIILGAVALFGTFFPGPFVLTQTFTIPPAEATLAIYLFRFFAIQVVFYGWTALTTGILNSYRHFTAPAAAPVLNNVVVTAVLLGVYLPLRESRPDLAVIALGVGTTLGVVALFAAQVPALLKLGFRFKPVIDLQDPAIRKMAVKMLPIVGYVAVNMVGVSFRNAFATQAFRDGSATLSYAWSWYQLPYGVLAVSLITALFPELSALAEKADWGGYKTTFSRGMRAMGVLILPSTAMLIALSVPLVTLYRFGSFPAEAVPLVGAVLSVWALGLFSFATYMLVLRGFYAFQDSRTPMFTNVFATIVQVGLYWSLTTFVIKGPYALLGIPTADAVAYTLHLGLLLFLLRRRVGSFDAGAV
jgi:putative peptidoglycan lipid II flippase